MRWTHIRTLLKPSRGSGRGGWEAPRYPQPSHGETSVSYRQLTRKDETRFRRALATVVQDEQENLKKARYNPRVAQLSMLATLISLAAMVGRALELDQAKFLAGCQAAYDDEDIIQKNDEGPHA